MSYSGEAADKQLPIRFAMRTALGPALIAAASAMHPPFGGPVAASFLRVRSVPYWLGLHLVLLAAVVILDGGLLAWSNTLNSPWAAVCRIGAGVNVIFYSGFVAIDGIAASVLAHGNASVGTTAVAELFGSSLVNSFGWLGGFGWVMAAAAVLAGRLRSKSMPGPALVLLIGSAWLAVSHAFPIGVVGGIAAAAAGLWQGALYGSRPKSQPGAS